MCLGLSQSPSSALLIATIDSQLYSPSPQPIAPIATLSCVVIVSVVVVLVFLVCWFAWFVGVSAVVYLQVCDLHPDTIYFPPKFQNSNTNPLLLRNLLFRKSWCFCICKCVSWYVFMCIPCISTLIPSPHRKCKKKFF